MGRWRKNKKKKKRKKTGRGMGDGGESGLKRKGRKCLCLAIFGT